MKLKIITVLGIVFILTGCGSSQIVVSKERQKKVIETIVKEVKKLEPKKETKPVVVETPSKGGNTNVDDHIKDLQRGNTYLSKTTLEYVRTYAPTAIHEMKAYKIPASITLAQGILESGSGRGQLAARSNNHFGIKCHSSWTGERVYHDDDKRGECFRKYKYVATSYKDHSLFLYGRKRYASLFKLKITDYKGWAYGLKRAGYATDPKYPTKLIKLIDSYKLYKFDNPSATIVTVPKPKEPVKTVGKYHEVAKGDTLYSIARRYGITVGRLKETNDLSSNALSIGQHLLIN